MKTCKKCGGDPQPKENFYRATKNKDGMQHNCKKCQIVARRRRREYMAPIKNAAVKLAPMAEAANHYEAACDTGDIRGTKMWQNRHFVSGDGGYRHYIDNPKQRLPLPTYAL